MIPLFKVAVDVQEATSRIRKVLESGMIAQGPVVDEFEKALADVLEVDPESVITVNSGTSAIQLALSLCGAGPGKEVVMPPVTCSADAHAVLAVGAKIVWCDVDPSNGLMFDPLPLVNDNTVAIVPTDWGGLVPPCAPASMKVSCNGRSIPVIQDAAHNFPTRKMYGDYVCLSFQAIKHLTTGDGGALIVRDPEKAKEARLRRWFSLDRRSSSDFRCKQNAQYPGYKFHMNDISAAIGLANLPLALMNSTLSRLNARYYQMMLPPSVLIPWQPEAPYWIYTILIDNRDEFIKYMADNGVQCSPVHGILTNNDVFPKASLPGAEHFSSRNVAIPSGFWVTEADRSRIVDLVNDFTGAN